MNSEQSARERAIASLHQKQGFIQTLISFILVNAFLWGIWLFSSDKTGFPWPAYVTLLSGLGIALSWWRTFGQGQITEADIDREIARQRDAAA